MTRALLVIAALSAALPPLSPAPRAQEAAGPPAWAKRAADAGPAARVLIAAAREAELSSEIAGRITSLPVEEGGPFAKGDALATFACDLHRAGLAEAQAEHAAARATLANRRELADLGSIGDLDVALARAEATRTAARIAHQMGMVERCTITAPYAGRVVERFVEPHESVAAGDPVLSIIDDRALTLELVVPSAWLAWLTPDTRFTVTIDETGTTHAAQVTMLGARIDAVSQSLPIRAQLVETPGNLVAGMSGTAQFTPARRGRLSAQAEER